jgi:hypothetical protein
MLQHKERRDAPVSTACSKVSCELCIKGVLIIVLLRASLHKGRMPLHQQLQVHPSGQIVQDGHVRADSYHPLAEQPLHMRAAATLLRHDLVMTRKL